MIIDEEVHARVEMDTSRVDEFFEHYGVKGMHWGVRRAEKRAAKADAKWQKNIYSVRGAVACHNAVADRMNNGGLDKLNNQPKYKSKNLLNPETGDPVGALGKQYLKDYGKLTEKFSHEAVVQVHGTSPSGKYVAKLDTSDPEQWKVKVVSTSAQHAVVGLPDLTIEVEHDALGAIISAAKVKDSVVQSDDSVGEFFAHYGVKGMRWGVRKDRPGGVSRSVDRSAKKDAHEFARAKAYYGDGAGTRRKLIKQTVEAKSNRVPGYKTAFDHHLRKQDQSKHVSKAVSERHRTDRREKTKQRAGAVARRLTGEWGTQAAFVALAASGAAYLNSGRGQVTMMKARFKINDIIAKRKQKQGARYLADYFKRNA